MAAEKIYIPQSLLALRQELEYHPQLLATLTLSPDHGFLEQLAVVATYCNIAVDGYFTPAGLSALADQLVEALREKRTIIVN